MGRRIDIERDDVGELGDKAGIARALEGASRCGGNLCARQMRCTEPKCTDSNGWYRAAIEFGQNGFGGFSPDEGFGVGIVFGQISIDRRLQVNNRAEDPATDGCRVILEKKFSTPLSQDAEVRVK
jgi:hypothetical protein